ncbi:Hypothetical predicted protein [Cloeon dipterum]|uniref:Uncharacterized protein n=1 Tax=Cloeon dipterum TaxID=197152 RepID=A0A8S1CT28_9INSE|nr:Hypothetical predicted protein [Cloeon dipterum]
MWKARRSQTQGEKGPYKSTEQGRNEQKSGPRVYQARINLRVGKGRAKDLKIPASERSGSGCCRFLLVSAVAGATT